MTSQHGGLIDGKGHLIFVKDLAGHIAVICPKVSVLSALGRNTILTIAHI